MDYLLFLQDLREIIPYWINNGIYNIIEFIYDYGTMMIMTWVYWCISKHAGIFLLMNHALANLCLITIKNILKIKRPFHYDTRLHPFHSFGDYSFPSGHTMLTAAVCGGLATWQKKHKRVVIPCVLLTVIIGFSRNWFGAHTLADVSAGLLFSCGIIAFNYFLLKLLDRYPNKDWCVVIGALFICIVSYFISPVDMRPASFYAGIVIGWFFERRFIRFENKGSLRFRIITYIGGIFVLGACNMFIFPLMCTLLHIKWEGVFINFFTSLLITAGWPAVIKQLYTKQKKDPSRI